MNAAFLHSHSGLRYVVLILLLVSIYNAYAAMSGKKELSAQAKKMSLFTLIFTHVQIILGLVMYFISPKVQFNSGTMGDAQLRFFTMEHILMMLIAVTLITVGYRMSKQGNAKKMFWYYFIGLVVIFAAIPWPFRTVLGGHWF